jgi:lysophospholipase L1-like esterase
MKNSLKALFCALVVIPLFFSASYALIPNPLISKEKTIKSSSTSNLSSLVDGKFSSSGWSISANSWVAINVGKGPLKVFLCWDSPMQIWSDSVALPLATNKSCPQTVNMPFEYTISTSDSSSTGSDGQWTDVVSVKNNVVAGRGHPVDFAGKSWIKMSIAKGSGQLDEVGVFDASNGLQDSWIFIGTSISQMAFRSNIPSSGFCEIVNSKHSTFNPAIIRGGIGCIFSANLADDVSKYLANAGNVHFWAIEMGTNDNWDKLPASTFKANLQRVIDSCKAHQIEPVIARMIATVEAKVGWQVSPDYLAAIDDLTSKNNLVPGPDLYNYFLQNPTQLNSDGVHPTATGAASIQRLWAEKMDTAVYKANSSVKPPTISKNTSHHFNAFSQSKRIVLRAEMPGIASIFSINGEIQDKIELPQVGSYGSQITTGFYLIRFESTKGTRETIPVLNR